MRDLLLELGVEELPATHLLPAEDYIRSALEKLLQDSGLSYTGLQVSSTPRRLFALVWAVQEKQSDARIKRVGPAKSVAFDAAGNLTPAGAGFLRKNSANPEDLSTETTDKGEFVVLDLLQPGKATADILRDWIPDLIPRIPFPKTMLWNESRLAFSRPLRWICLLWGEEVLKIGISGLSSNNCSYGNRYLGLDTPVQINTPAEYLPRLRQAAVLADRIERRKVLYQSLGEAVGAPGLHIVPDERLIDTVTDLVEYPTAVAAGFDAAFLQLPDKIITSTISQNQKCFSVLDQEGRLVNRFVFVSNGDPNCADLIRCGNEKVVAARLADALWYFREDTRVPLESFLPRLEEVVFQSQLGSMAAKTRRIHYLAGQICAQLGLTGEQAQLVLRTALLCKADLVTTMLGEKEFTKLQGYIGQQYALACGEPEEVAAGIYEHYQPRGSNDSLPQTTSGAVVALADKLDSVCGIIGIGLLPTGSADPYALRRAANGVIQIIVDRGWPVMLGDLLDRALASVAQDAELTLSARDTVQHFFRQRVEYMLRQLDLDYDVADSVMRFSLDSLPQLRKRATALQSFRQREDFLRLVIGYKRVANIIDQAEAFAPLQIELFQARQERDLHDGLQNLRQDLDARLKAEDFTGAISCLVTYGLLIDSFFDAVLVNCEDQALRDNRYALLNLIKHEFLRVADIAQIVFENDIEERQ